MRAIIYFILVSPLLSVYSQSIESKRVQGYVVIELKYDFESFVYGEGKDHYTRCKCYFLPYKKETDTILFSTTNWCVKEIAQMKNVISRTRANRLRKIKTIDYQDSSYYFRLPNHRIKSNSIYTSMRDKNTLYIIIETDMEVWVCKNIPLMPYAQQTEYFLRTKESYTYHQCQTIIGGNFYAVKKCNKMSMLEEQKCRDWGLSKLKLEIINITFVE